MGSGSANTSNSDLPSRPKFQRDIRSVSWTDGRGNQEVYAHAVKQWGKFHDGLLHSNSNKIATSLPGIFLEAQLYGRAMDLCKCITDEQLASDKGASLIVKAIYQRNAISVVSEVYRDFTDILSTKRGCTESFKNYESRFMAQVSKFNENGDSIKFHDSIISFMLLSNASVDDSQHISIISYASSTASDEIDPDASNDTYLETIKYNSVASILR